LIVLERLLDFSTAGVAWRKGTQSAAVNNFVAAARRAKSAKNQ